MSATDTQNKKAEKRVSALEQAVRGLGGPARRVLQKRLGQAAVAQAQLGVRRGQNPYGKTWAPLTSRIGRPLRRTGNNIQRSWTAGQEDQDSFRFGSRFKYLATHQYGAVIRPRRFPALHFFLEGAKLKGGWNVLTEVFAKKVVIPQRQMVPMMRTGGLGKRWFGAFQRTVRRFIKELTQPKGKGK